MGHTHCYGWHLDGDQQRWANALTTVMQIVQHSPVPLGDAYGEGAEPEYGDERIALNGRGDDGAQTFWLPVVLALAPDDGDFCKTYLRPYDAVVTAVLAALVHMVPDIFVLTNTDGMPKEWLAGVRLARQLLGDPTIPIPAYVGSGHGWEVYHWPVVQQQYRECMALLEREAA